MDNKCQKVPWISGPVRIPIMPGRLRGKIPKLPKFKEALHSAARISQSSTVKPIANKMLCRKTLLSSDTETDRLMLFFTNKIYAVYNELTYQ